MQKLLLFPLRLCVGWGLSPRLLSLIGATMLVLLRVSIGWHFYSEGVDKYQSGKWDAAPFFANARGPFADEYRKLVWDADGSFRRDVEATEKHWNKFRDRLRRHYQFNDDQKKASQRIHDEAVKRVGQVLQDNATILTEYDLGLQRMADLNDDPSREGVASLRGQRETIRREILAQVGPVLAQIDAVWANYESAQNAIASSEQQDQNPKLELGKPPLGRMDTYRMNRIVPYFDLTIGLCLLFGFFTPVAALAAAAFLGSVFLGQYPPTTGPTSSNYQLVECMACLVVAATGSGRFAGLDYFLHLVVRKSWAAPTDKG
ncbi:MAG: DoxX family protein [Pirellulales bacterium]|nr:DoxX family protein [Pirellulales bacterium]